MIHDHDMLSTEMQIISSSTLDGVMSLVVSRLACLGTVQMESGNSIYKASDVDCMPPVCNFSSG